MKPFRISRSHVNPVIARSVPFLLFIALLMLGSSGLMAGENAAVSWLVVARGAVVALVLFWFWPSYGELHEPPLTSPGQWLLAALAGIAVFLVWIGFNQGWAVLSSAAGVPMLLPEGGMDWPKALGRLAGFALVVPVMEELFWRSLVLRWIEREDFLSVAPRRVGTRAFVITTILFAVEHEHWFAGAIAGVVYNGLYMRSGNLWVPIMAHAVTNASLGIWILYTHNWQFW